METKQELSTVLYAQPLHLGLKLVRYQHQTEPERVSSCRNALATDAT